MNWGDVSYIFSRPLSKKILEVLKNELAPLQIVEKVNTARGNVSTKLVQLKKRELVKCLNLDAKKWRFYAILEKGNNVLKKVGEVLSRKD